MEIRQGTALFEPHAGSGPQRRTVPLSFARPVLTAFPGITGYFIGFREPTNHPLGRIHVELENWIVSGNTVIITVALGLRDWSGNWDDAYEGSVNVVVVADTEPPAAVAPSRELSVTGIEVTQAIQYFRSAQHLGPVGSRRDNSVPLVAGKPTTARVYTDFSSSRFSSPLIIGEMEVRSSTQTRLIRSPSPPILSRRDSQIDRGQSTHTINFNIPAELCQGIVILRCQVATTEAGTPRSEAFEITVLFREIPPLQVHAVPFNVSAEGSEYGWPSDIDAVRRGITSLFQSATRVLPIKEFSLNINDPVDTSANFTRADQGEGGFNHLIDRLIEMRGSSDSIFVGFVPDSLPPLQVAGMAERQRAAAVESRDFMLLAHELAHVLGRKHAPGTSVFRDRASFVDETYPTYGSYPPGSIGEYGYDPTDSAYQVKSPATTVDLMVPTRSNSWVSPYTYLEIMRALLVQANLGWDVPRPLYLRWNESNSHGCFEPRQIPQKLQNKAALLLNLTIHSNARIELAPAFHFIQPYEPPLAAASEYWVEFDDSQGRSIIRYPLHKEPDDMELGPLRFREAVPFPSNAWRFSIGKRDKRIYEKKISKPPTVRMTTDWVEQERGFRIEWRVTEDRKTMWNALLTLFCPNRRPSHWYLVQMEEEEGVWRGLMPRTQETFAFIPEERLGTRQEVKIRVLATSGFATGSSEAVLKRRNQTVPRPRLIISGYATRRAEDNSAAPILQVALVSEDGKVTTKPDVIWYDGTGKEIGSGNELHLAAFDKTDIVKAVAKIDNLSLVGQTLRIVPSGEDICLDVITQGTAISDNSQTNVDDVK